MTVTSWQSEKARRMTHTFVIAVIFCLPELLCFLVSFLDCKLPHKGRLTLFHLLSLAWGKIKWNFSLSPFLCLPFLSVFNLLSFPPLSTFPHSLSQLLSSLSFIAVLEIKPRVSRILSHRDILSLLPPLIPCELNSLSCFSKHWESYLLGPGSLWEHLTHLL